jgi:hypothetical protein
MIDLKLRAIEDDKPVKLSIELPADLHRDLITYGRLIGEGVGQQAVEPGRLIAPMLARFIASDRAFKKARRKRASTK